MNGRRWPRSFAGSEHRTSVLSGKIIVAASLFRYDRDMKSAFLTSLCAVLLTLGLTSCPETKVSKDFGGNILQFNREDWEGDWKSADSSDNVKFVVKDTAAGQLTLFITVIP